MLNSECLNRFSALCSVPEERLWSFVFTMSFIFQHRTSQYIINIYRTSESKVMVVQICVGIPFPLSSAMKYYGPQLDIRVKTFARRNSPESSLLNFESLDRLPNLFGDSAEKLWLFEFMMGLVFQLRASQYIMSFNRTSELKVIVVRICVGIPFQLSNAMIYCGAQLDIQLKTFARRNFPESSLFNSECLNRFPTICGDPEERLSPFVFVMGFIFNQRPSQYIIINCRTSESKVMARIFLVTF